MLLPALLHGWNEHLWRWEGMWALVFSWGREERAHGWVCWGLALEKEPYCFTAASLANLRARAFPKPCGWERAVCHPPTDILERYLRHTSDHGPCLGMTRGLTKEIKIWQLTSTGFIFLFFLDLLKPLDISFIALTLETIISVSFFLKKKPLVWANTEKIIPSAYFADINHL